MSAGDKHSKTEAPTPKRKRDARKEGQVVRSEDLVTWTSVLVATSAMPMLVGRTSEVVRTGLRMTFLLAREPDERLLTTMVGRTFTAAFGAMLPVVLIMFAIAVAGNVAQVGLLLTGKPLKPKVSRLNPLQGLKRMFSVQSLWQTASAAMKLAIIAAVAATMVRGAAAEVVSAPMRSAAESVKATGVLALSLVRAVAAAALVVGIADYAFQRRKHARELRMTKQEIRQEMRESDGDPHVKSRQRQIRAAMSRNRMLAGIASADVVITNPTRLAVAIRYERGRGAPTVLARGADALAARIRQEAGRHNVPLVEAVPLARALYALCRVGEEIPPELYQGVATVLAFLHHLSAARRSFGGTIDLDVPDTWTPDDRVLRRIPPAQRRRAERSGRMDAADPAAGASEAVPGRR
ncbi:MAG: EscU/YscU/HrcU family type III secretion system export apparatus switch protein [Microthrixaceae bacterium]